MSLAFRAAAVGVSTTGGLATITIPGTVVVNDLLIVNLGNNSNTPYVFVGVDGWSPVRETVGGGSGQPGGTQMATVYSHRVVTGDAGSTVTFPVTPDTSAKVITLSAYYSTDPVKLAAIDNAAALMAPTSSATHTNPTLTGVPSGTWLVSAINKKVSGLSSITQPASYTPRGTHLLSAGVGCSIADFVTTSAGDQSGTWTTSTASQAASTFLMSLAEVDGEPPLPRPVMRRWNGTEWSLVG